MNEAVVKTRAIPSFWDRHEWSIIGLSAVFAFLLGCWGYANEMTFAASGGSNTWWDVVYASLQLFIFEGPDETAGWPLQLQIARALAPMVLLYTATMAIFNRTETQIALYKLLFRKRRFVVVCGVGETGFRIARDYLCRTDKAVVVIEIDPMNAMAAELSKLGAIVIHGNAMDPITLERARVVYAKEVFLSTNDDQANIAIAKAVDRMTRALTAAEVAKMAKVVRRHEPTIAGEAPYVGLRAFLCVDEPGLYEVFADHPFFAHANERFAIRIFNRKQTIARNLFTRCAPEMYGFPRTADDVPMHVLLVGFEALVRELILQTALTAHYPDFRRPRVTLLCRTENEEAVERFLYRFPNLAAIIDLRLCYLDPLTVTEQQWQELQGEIRFTVAYVGMRQDVESVLAARRLNRLRRLLEEQPLNIVVCLNQQTYLAEIIDDDFPAVTDDKHALPAREPIEYFETLDETINIDVVVNDALDTLARTMHNAYRDTQLARGENPVDNPSLLPWSELPAHKRQANQHAAAHIHTKLRCANRAVRAGAAVSPADFPQDAATLEVLAQLEHRRWMAEKQLAGYVYGEVRDEDLMTHPDLVPWEMLSEPVKEKDRDAIRQIPEMLALQGLQIVQAGPV